MLKYKASYYLTKADSATPTLLRLMVSFNGNRKEIYTGISVLPTDWDSKVHRVINIKDPRNKELDKLDDILQSIFNEFNVIHNRFPTGPELAETFAEKSGKKKEKKKGSLTFIEVINNYIEEKRESKQWTDGTERKYNKLRNHIKGFREDLVANDIDEPVIREMMKYFATGPRNFKTGEKKAAHRNTTIRRNIEDYLRILEWASKKGQYTGKVYEEFEQRFKGTQEKLSELVYLEWDELIALLNKDFGNKNYLARVRDVFCFCCFSSLRYSDVSKLKKTDIRDGYFLIATEKTTDPLSIDLNNFSQSILDKYKDVDLPKDLALPVISMAKMNEYLKKIGEIMEFNSPVKDHYFIGNKSHEEVYLKKDLLSTHAGRRTFVVNSLRLGIPVEVIIKWTGHKDFKALKPYVKIVDDLKRTEMNKFNTIHSSIHTN